jgi:ribosomal 50S subunit-recycling heat shock protein
MRLDKFLKYSGIMKRRTLAKRICDSRRCSINGRKAKPGSSVAVGDIIRLQIGMTVAEHEVLELMTHEVRKDQRDQYSRPVSSERVDPMDGLT